MPRNTVYSILNHLQHFPVVRKSGSGHQFKKMIQNKVNQLIKDFNHKASISQRQSARKFNISQVWVGQILKKNLVIVRKKMKISSRTDQQKMVARAKCGNLYRKNHKISWVLDDESYFILGHSTINGNNLFYTIEIAATPACVKFNPVKKFEPKLLVWLCISDKGISAPIFR